ncbi:MAG: helix-turn-helix domain-containing protein [Phycisphaerae bacterium]
MAKMYYSEEEAAQKLGVSPEGLQNLVSSGKLRVYQDGPRKMYKATEVEALTGGGEEEEIELAPVDDSDALTLDAADEEAAAPAGKEDTVITAEGISIFDDEDLEIEAADPMAKTQIAPSLEDQMALEGVGSGSGLLDLTRESDDTSLGAEVLDNIDVDSVVESSIPEPEPYQPAGQPMMGEPQVVEAPDPTAGLFGGFAVATMLLMVLVGMAAMAAMMGVVPGFVADMKANMTMVVGGAAVVMLIVGVIGYFVGKAIADKKQAMRHMGG